MNCNRGHSLLSLLIKGSSVIALESFTREGQDQNCLHASLAPSHRHLNKSSKPDKRKAAAQ